MRINVSASIAALVVMVAALVAGPLPSEPSTAALPAVVGGAECAVQGGNGFCSIYATLPVDTDGTRDPVTGFTPGPVVCAKKSFGPSGGYNTIDCQYGSLWWSNSRQCYVGHDAVQDPPPAGADPNGAWYSCNILMGAGGNTCDINEAGDPIPCMYTRPGESFFSATSPPGIFVVNPELAAEAFVAGFPLNAITIGLAPDPGVANSRTYVGVPVWMWADNPTPDTFGPYTETGTVGGLNITATATVTSLLWTMGDGTTVACATGGTPYQASLGFADSPNCGHRYSQTSASQPGGRFPITATSQWDVVWAIGDIGGTINVTTVAETSVEVRELQSVNVGN
jgi:hypothetical protein